MKLNKVATIDLPRKKEWLGWLGRSIGESVG